MSGNGNLLNGTVASDATNVDGDDPVRVRAKEELVSFLTSLLPTLFKDGDESISLDLIEIRPEVTALSLHNPGLIMETLPEVPGVTVDWAHKRVRMVRKSQRNTIILRNIQASEDEVRAIFQENGAPGQAQSVRSDIGDTWFVTFDTEQVAVDTLLWIRGQKFQDKPISARMKSETQQKGFFSDIPPNFANSSNGGRGQFHPRGYAPHSGNGPHQNIIHYSKDFILETIKHLPVSKPPMAECEAVTEQPNLKLEIQPNQPARQAERPRLDGHPHADAPEFTPQQRTPYQGQIPAQYAYQPDFRPKRARPPPNTQLARPVQEGRAQENRPTPQPSGEELNFNIDVKAISAGRDSRTTLMIKNIPNKYSQRMLLASVEETNRGGFDFIYLPIDFRVASLVSYCPQNWCNVGYAFINFLSTNDVAAFYEAFHGQKWKHFKSEKICQISYARIQGKDALIDHFARSRLLSEDKRCRPMVLDQGKLVPLTRRFWGDMTPDDL